MARTKSAVDPNIGKNIEAWMAMHPELKSQPLLAKRAGLAQSTVGRIIRGEVSPSASNLKKIADALGTDVNAFYLPHEEMVFFRDARLRGKEARFEGQTPRTLPVQFEIKELDQDRVLVEPSRMEGFVVGCEVHDGYVARCQHLDQLFGEYLVFERSGNPAYGDLCLVRVRDGTAYLTSYMSSGSEAHFFDDVVSTFNVGASRTIPKADVVELHGVVAILSSRQWRPTKPLGGQE